MLLLLHNLRPAFRKHHCLIIDNDFRPLSFAKNTSATRVLVICPVNHASLIYSSFDPLGRFELRRHVVSDEILSQRKRIKCTQRPRTQRGFLIGLATINLA